MRQLEWVVADPTNPTITDSHLFIRLDGTLVKANLSFNLCCDQARKPILSFYSHLAASLNEANERESSALCLRITL